MFHGIDKHRLKLIIFFSNFMSFLQLCIEKCDSPIRSVELQLVRVETCGCSEGYSRDGNHLFSLYLI